MTPLLIYSTQNGFNDSSSDDMRYGDLTDSCLQNHFNLRDVSTVVNPYSMELLPAFSHPHNRFYYPTTGKRISKHECIKLMFDDLRRLTLPFSFWGPNTDIIKQMITHLQTAQGRSFSNVSLNSAFNHQIISDNSPNSSLKRIKEILDKNIDYEKKYLPIEALPQITLNIKGGILPKFTRAEDNFNGLGLAVHDMYSMEITIDEIDINQSEYRCLIRYKAQDHFGLDQNDIKDWKFQQFYFFKTWFVLQRSQNYGFKPFFTNIETYIKIKGKRNA
ncbi:DUF3289 family protein [uncultured Pluralibacter sp.]|uniref:DUF3289 family protein n=1 Tax=uncultured Pluralibacter sp. TaxID=1490864 RepID=UPI00262306B5|nr:DUF3289 family protein [uncultured Pluralibacter sp.]